MLFKVSSLLALVALIAAQDTGVLRVRVTLANAGVPRVFLLISDNPATAAPRRVRTAADGSVELKLEPGSYTVESDAPVTREGNAYTWTETIVVVAGKDTVLELTAANAAIETAAEVTQGGAGAATDADSAAHLPKWRDAVVEIWTPTRHASGFLIDSRGVIATSHHALGNASAVEVEITAGANRFKVPGSVLASDRATGAAFVRIDPQQMAVAPIALDCARGAWPPVAYEQDLITIAAPMLVDKDLIDGAAIRVTSQAVFADMRLARDSAGGPVFSESGELLGLSALNEDEERRIREPWVVPLERVCETFTAASKGMAAVAAPPGTRLPVEPRLTASASRGRDIPQAQAASRRPQAAKMSSDDFDITLLTPALVRAEPDRYSPLADFGYWTDYVRDAPALLLIRISPQYEESFWKTLARGAAATQGMALPPLKSFSSNFLRLRAYCGEAEVAPIHPLIIERQVSEKGSIREGLYVFSIDAFGAHCASVRLAMYSEKDPQKADIKMLDAKLFEQVAKSGVQ